MGHKKKNMGSQALSQMRQAGMDLSLALAGCLNRTILHAPDGTLPGSCLPPDAHLCCPAQILLHHPLVAATSALYCERPADWMRKLVQGLKQNNGRGHVNPNGQPLEA